MPTVRLIDRPAFTLLGRQTWISGPDNDQFGAFWQQSRADGLLDALRRIQQTTGLFPGPQTGAAVLGVSRVEKDPARRDFNYMIAIEAPAGQAASLAFLHPGLEVYQAPAARWAVFECRGPIPGAIVESEIYAFTQWLPGSGLRHALAPEMEVYPASNEPDYCEFWLPVEGA